jgi:uncharacterized alpha-E superfamily protein
MLSRAAESLYWMSRYAERAENVARFLDVSSQVVLDLPDAHANPWAAVVAATGDEDLFAERYGAPTRDSVVRFLTVDTNAPNSIASCLRHARDNARSIREAISSEMWEQINKWYLMVREAAATATVIDDPHDFLTAVKEASQNFVGVTYLTMTHNEGWHFGRIGRVLERADQTSRIIDARQALMPKRARGASIVHDEIDLTALLRSVSALEMYRKRHGRIDYTEVIAFLVLEKRFPRSIRHCLDAGQESLSAVTGTGTSDATATLPERLLGRLRAEYEYAVIGEILEGLPGAPRTLHEHLDDFQLKLNDVGSAVFGTFFATRPEPPPPAPSVSQVPAPPVVEPQTGVVEQAPQAVQQAQSVQ